VDRIVLKPEIRSRLADSIETATKLAQGLVIVSIGQPDGTWKDQVFSEKFACPIHSNVSLPELEPRLFSFNSPHGACPKCHGLGTKSEFDPDLIVPDDSLSLESGAIEAWRKHGKRMNIYYSRVLRTICRDFGISYSMPYKDIPKKQRDILMFGSSGEGTEFEGVIPNLQRRFENTESEWVKHKMHSYMSEQPCDVCHGTRLRKEAMCVRLHTSTMGVSPMAEINQGRDAQATVGKKSKKAKAELVSEPTPVVLPGNSIDDVARMTVEKAKLFFDTWMWDLGI
jgi:excinuclease ABC subunit A